MKRFQKLAATTTAMTLVLITIGGLVRASGSGLGCPDWPKCYGRWIPPMNASSLIEYSHRLAASVVGVLILALAVYAWARFRSHRFVFWGSLTALITVIVQAWIGRQVVLGELPRNLVVLHFFMSTTVVGALAVVTGNAMLPRGGRLDRVARIGWLVAGLTWTTLIVGAFVSQYHAALAYSDWPLMDGSLLPGGGGTKLLHWVHRLMALGLGAATVWFWRESRRTPRRPNMLVRITGALLLVWVLQVLAGGLNVLSRLDATAVVLHVALGALFWTTSLLAAIAAYRTAPAESAQASREDGIPGLKNGGVKETVKAYFLLTKPRIIELLLIATIPAMILAARGWPSLRLMSSTLLGGWLTAGAANAINCFFDRDIDEAMSRTRGRPLPSRMVPPERAATFGVLLGLAGVIWLAVEVNLLAASLSGAAILFYVFVYTLWLKRTTPSNIVIGGAAGAVPVLVGWAAVTGTLAPPAWILFAIIFFWTPPHFWALAIKYRDDYAAAGVPMLPVVRGAEETARQIKWYSWVLVSVSLVLFSIAELGVIYLGLAFALGAVLVWYSVRLANSPGPKIAMQLFHFSLVYLAVLLIGASIDRLIDSPHPSALYGPVLLVSAIVFTVFEAIIVASVFGYRKETSRRFLPELVWTVLPMALVVAMVALQSGIASR